MNWVVSPLIVLVTFILAALAAVVLSPLAIGGGPIDNPRDRGNHSEPTPTSGGLAIMAAAAFAIGVVLGFWGRDIPGSFRDGLALFGFACVMGISGALDDMFDMPPKLRLLFQAIVCLVFAYFYRVTTLDFGFGLNVHVWPPIGLLGSALWLMLGVNAVNFMDGSNGLAVGVQGLVLLVLSALMIMAAGESALGPYLGLILIICVASAGAHAGFLPFNLPMGKVFQGDAGALFGGALITAAVLVLKAYGAASVWIGGFVLAPLLVDVVLTLVTRLLQRKDVFRPHREHLYQLWLQYRDPSHARLAFWVWGLCGVTSLIGLLAHLAGSLGQVDLRFPLLVLTVAALSLGWVLTRRRLLKAQSSS